MTRIRALIHLWGHFIDDEGTLAWLEDHLLPEVTMRASQWVTERCRFLPWMISQKAPSLDTGGRPAARA